MDSGRTIRMTLVGFSWEWTSLTKVGCSLALDGWFVREAECTEPHKIASA